jgi:hypothetical protein
VALLLDTTVLIDALRGRPAAQRLAALREHGEVPYFCAVNADELMRGVRVEEIGRAAVLMASLRTAPMNYLAGALAGTWRREFAKQGITLHQSDCLVAAAAVGVHATIATGNPEHFPMDGVTVEHWPVGE